MQQLNVHDYYELGKKIAELEKQIGSASGNGVLKLTLSWPLFLLRWHFESMLQEPCALLPASKRSARAIIKTITELIPEDIKQLFDIDKDEVVQDYQLSSIKSAFTSFETVLKNDMPEMSTFAVAQIGILRTDDLINNAHRQIAEPLQMVLEDKAKADIIEAGKCLSFRLSTASAFHVCRAVETGIDQYYEVLVGKPYAVSSGGGNNNWGAKIAALKTEGGVKKVTEFLDHIRSQYRNPVTHPEVTVDEHEAVDLFMASLSAVSMMLGEVKKSLNKPAKPQKSLSNQVTASKKLGTGKP